VSFVIVMVLLLVVMYVLMIRPQRQRQAQTQSMIDAAGVGEDILTTGGIYGTIVEIDGDDVVVEIADGLNVHMTRRAIAAVLPPEDEDEEEADEDDDADVDVVEGEAVEEPATGEAAVADGEEVVTSEGTAQATAESRR
jgi:preprotein translocase subunit YajC